MKPLQDRLQQLATSLRSQGHQDRVLRSEFDSILKALFPNLKNPESFIGELRMINKALVIKTVNKVFANELFMQADAIRGRLASRVKFPIQKIIVQ